MAMSEIEKINFTYTPACRIFEHMRLMLAATFNSKRTRHMKTVGDKLEAFSVTGVKPGFNQHEEKGQSAFETITEKSFSGKWKVIYFYPKDFTFVCPTEITGYAKLAKDFADRDAAASPLARSTTSRSTSNSFWATSSAR